ncbi:glycoside hydrolase family protein [Hymenobacter daeguensis]
MTSFRRKAAGWLFLWLVVGTGAVSAQQRNYHPSMDEAAATAPAADARPVRPLFDAAMQDVYVLPHAGTYYLTGTTPGAGIQLWTSRDRQTWQKAGKLWNEEAVAPQIHFVNGRFYLVYGKPGGGIVLLSAASIGGKFQKVSQLTSTGTDPGLFIDDDGTTYLYYGAGMVAPLTADLTALRESAFQVKPRVAAPDQGNEFTVPFTFKREPPVTDRVGKRGFFIAKLNGQYCFFANEVTGRMNQPTDDVYYVTAEHLRGPYSDRNLVIPNGGQSCVFAADNRIFATFYGNDPAAAIYHKPAIIELTTNDLHLLLPAPNVILEKGPVARAHSLLGSERMRDPSVTLGNDGYYYAVGTKDFGWIYPEGGIEMWRSKDLASWEPLGFVWTFARDGSAWMRDAIHPRGDKKMLWAPEVAYLKGNYWITTCLNVGKTTILKSTTGQPTGPYREIETAPLADGIDGFLFEDTDKQVYLVWGDGNIARLKDDMSGFAEAPRKLKTVNNEHVGYEGNCLFKVNGKYIMAGAEWNGPLRTEGTYDMMYAVADNIYGPYSARQVGVPHGGHGTVFMGRNGEWYSTFFGNDRTAPFRRRLGIVPLSISPDFRITPKE